MVDQAHSAQRADRPEAVDRRLARGGASVDEFGCKPNGRLQRQRSVVGVLYADVDLAAGAQRLVVVDVSGDVDGAGRHVSQRDVRERQRRVGGDQQRHPLLVEAGLRHLAAPGEVVIAEHEELPARGGGHPIEPEAFRLPVRATSPPQSMHSSSPTVWRQALWRASSICSQLANGLLV